MARYSETSKEIVTVTESDTVSYQVELNVTRTELRRGTYSSTALDPDEYYGEWAIDTEVIGAMRYDEGVPEDNEDDYEVWLDVWDLPDWVIAEAEYEFEE